MKVGISAKPAFSSQRTGVDEYAYHLIRSLTDPALGPVGPGKRRAKTHADEIILYTDRVPPVIEEDFWGHRLPENVHVRLIKSPFLWSQGRLALELLKDKVDAFFNPVHILPFSAPKNRSTITIHDLSFEYYPQDHAPGHVHYLRSITRHAVRAASKIIAVSENTKRDLVDMYNISPLKVIVIHHGIRTQGPAATTSEQPASVTQDQLSLYPFLKDPYFLFVGRLDYKKNIEGIISSFTLLKQQYHVPHKLIIMGPADFGAGDIVRLAQEHKDIIVTGFVPESIKQLALRRATALLLLSFYEGFGFPILEAQSAGVPVIASNVASLPEVAGDAALLINPRDHAEIARAMHELITHPKLATTLIRRGFENTKRFSWDRCAAETWRVITSPPL